MLLVQRKWAMVVVAHASQVLEEYIIQRTRNELEHLLGRKVVLTVSVGIEK